MPEPWGPPPPHHHHHHGGPGMGGHHHHPYYYMRRGPIQKAPGYAYGTPKGVNNLSVFGTLASEIKYSIKKNGPLKGIVFGFYSFVTDPFLEYRFALSNKMAERAFKEGRITKEQYDYRMVRNEERILYKKLKLNYITSEEYNNVMDEVEKAHSTVRR